MNKFLLLTILLLSSISCSGQDVAISDHSDGKTFHNTENPKLDTIVDATKVSWELFTKKKN